MPQMWPMIWFVFPFIMVILLLVKMATLNGKIYVKGSGEWEGKKDIKGVKW